MEQYYVKRGVIKDLGPGGLAQLGAKHFDNVVADAEGGFVATKGIMTKLDASYNKEGKLVVDVEQSKGADLSDFLSADGGREAALSSRAAFSAFLDSATGYNSKQRGDKAKEDGKKAGKARTNVKMARKLMSISTKITDEMKVQANEFIVQIEEKLDEGNFTRAMSLSEKLSKLVEFK